MSVAVDEWSVRPPPAWDAWWAVSIAALLVAIAATLVSVVRSEHARSSRCAWIIACLVASFAAVPAWWILAVTRRGANAPTRSKHARERGGEAGAHEAPRRAG